MNVTYSVGQHNSLPEKTDLGVLRTLAPKFTVLDNQKFEAPFQLTKHCEFWGELCNQSKSTLLEDIIIKYQSSFISPPGSYKS